MEDQWLKWAKRLQAIASTGLHFSKDDFDRERYREVATIAQSMLASLGNIPIKRIEGLLSDFAKGYATPKIDVRGAVIEDRKGCSSAKGGMVYGHCLQVSGTGGSQLLKMSKRKPARRLLFERP